MLKNLKKNIIRSSFCSIWRPEYTCGMSAQKNTSHPSRTGGVNYLFKVFARFGLKKFLV